MHLEQHECQRSRQRISPTRRKVPETSVHDYPRIFGRFGYLFALNLCYVPSRRRPPFVVSCSFCAISGMAGGLARNGSSKEWHFF